MRHNVCQALGQRGSLAIPLKKTDMVSAFMEVGPTHPSLKRLQKSLFYLNLFGKNGFKVSWDQQRLQGPSRPCGMAGHPVFHRALEGAFTGFGVLDTKELKPHTGDYLR